jgi:hypothetical protein
MSPPVELILLAIAAAVYALAYLGHPLLPGANPAYPEGWWGWWDQGQYHKSAAALAAHTLNKETYWYPLGYPLLGAVTYRWAPTHSFFVPNILLVLGLLISFYRIALHLISRWEAIGLICIFTFAYSRFICSALVIPWNTIPTHLLSYAVIALVGVSHPRPSRIIAASAAVGLTYLCRPIDAVCLTIAVCCSTLGLPTWARRIRTGSLGALIVLFFVLSVFLVNLAVFGHWATAYDVVSRSMGFASYSIFQKLYWIFLDASPVFREHDTALLPLLPWLLLIVPGLVQLVRKHGAAGVGVILSIGATYAAYLLYNDFWPQNIFRFHAFHYLFWTWPILFLITYVGLRTAWTERWARWSLLSALVFGALVCSVTLKEREIENIVLSSPATVGLRNSGDWLFIPSAVAQYRLLVNGRELLRHEGYYAVDRPEGTILLFSKDTRGVPASLEIVAVAEPIVIRVGLLQWVFGPGPNPFLKAIRRYLMRPTIRTIGKLPGKDVAGPDGGPDGKPDYAIEVRGRTSMIQQIVDWEIVTENGHGRWTKEKNPHGWWLITPEIAEDSESQRVVNLFFPDEGDFERAGAYTIRAVDKKGNLVFEQTVKK